MTPTLHACMPPALTKPSRSNTFEAAGHILTELLGCVCARALWWSKGGTISDVMWQYQLLTALRYSACRPLVLCRGGGPQEAQKWLDCRNKSMIIHSGSLLLTLHKRFTYSETEPAINIVHSCSWISLPPSTSCLNTNHLALFSPCEAVHID